MTTLQKNTAERLKSLLEAMDHHDLSPTVDTKFRQLARTTMQELEAIIKGPAPTPVAAPRPVLATGFRFRPKGEEGWKLALNREPDAGQLEACDIERIEVVGVGK